MPVDHLTDHIKELIRIIENYIRHDIYTNSLVEDNLEYLTKRYGKREEDYDAPFTPVAKLFYSKGI